MTIIDMNTEARLQKIINDIDIISEESRRGISLEKKLENYNMANILLQEATHLSSLLKEEIANIKITPATLETPSTSFLLDFANKNKLLNINELTKILSELKNLQSNVVTPTLVTRDIEMDAICEKD